MRHFFWGMAWSSSRTGKAPKTLREEFLKPIGISAYELAQRIHLTRSRVNDIVRERLPHAIPGIAVDSRRPAAVAPALCSTTGERS
jgi:hypothetical protein